MSDVTVATIRKGWKGYSDSFDFWLGNYENNTPTWTNSSKDEEEATTT